MGKSSTPNHILLKRVAIKCIHFRLCSANESGYPNNRRVIAFRALDRISIVRPCGDALIPPLSASEFDLRPPRNDSPPNVSGDSPRSRPSIRSNQGQQGAIRAKSSTLVNTTICFSTLNIGITACTPRSDINRKGKIPQVACVGRWGESDAKLFMSIP